MYENCLTRKIKFENGLMRKIRLNSKFMTTQPGKQTNKKNILPNISRIRRSQTMTFGQLIQNNMRNIFLQKSLGQH